MNLLRWILCPPFMVFRTSADNGGGDGGAAAQAQADEARKASLRSKIDALYGVSSKVPIYGDAPTSGGPFLRAFAQKPVVGYQDDPVASDAAKKMQADDTSVSDATRSYYGDQLNRSFGAAERNARFRLARQGLLGGSSDVDTKAELETDRTLGATRIDQAARSSAASLDAQREGERMNAINLVNAGAGESAVASAQAGLRNSLNTAQSSQKANLFGDLFSAGADSYSNAQNNDALMAMLGRYQQQLGSYFPTSSTSSGRVTPSS